MSGAIESFTGFMSKHSSGITTGASILGLVGTVVLAVRATPTAHDILEQTKLDLEECDEIEAKQIKRDAVKDMAKLYLPSFITGGLTIACIIGTRKLSFSAGESATLGAAQLMMNQAILDYREEVRNEIGERREKEVYGRVLEKEYKRHDGPAVIVTPSDDSYWMYDSACKVKFKSNVAAVKMAILNLNTKLLNEDTVTVADLYSELGIPYGIAQEKLHWNIKDGYIEEYYRAEADPDTGAPMLTISYYVEPGEKR